MFSLKNVYTTRNLWLVLIIVCVLNCGVPAGNSKVQETVYHGGIRNSTGPHRLNQKELNLLLNALKNKTGFQTMSFDEQGFLDLGDRERAVNGSAAARRLLISAVESPLQISLESHRNSKSISFSRIISSTEFIRMSTQEHIEIRPILIDFRDFDFLQGDRDVVASFDLGITILHELVHGVYNLHDNYEFDEVGECDSYINAIRHELNLPEREQYLAQSSRLALPFGKPIMIASLPFSRKTSKNGKTKNERVLLQWNTDQVGIVERPQNNAIANTSKKDPAKAAAAVPQ